MFIRINSQSLKNSLLILTLAAFISSCANMTNQEKGAMVGTVLGGIAGALIGDGGGQFVAAVVGTAVGATIGAAVGRKLDELEELKAAVARNSALEAQTGRQLSWKSETNPDVGGSAESVDEPKQKGESVCRNVREITVIGGEESKFTKEYCWNGNKWSPA